MITLAQPKIGLITLCLALLAGGCASAPRTTPEQVQARSVPTLAPEWQGSELEIDYTLGHVRRQIRLSATDQIVRGESFYDKTLLKKTSIEPRRYQEFAEKVRDFAEKRRKLASPADTEPDCHASFSVTIRNQKDKFKIQGCRGTESGAFSHLVKDGEFLILSQSGASESKDGVKR